MRAVSGRPAAGSNAQRLPVLPHQHAPERHHAVLCPVSRRPDPIDPWIFVLVLRSGIPGGLGPGELRPVRGRVLLGSCNPNVPAMSHGLGLQWQSDCLCSLSWDGRPYSRGRMPVMRPWPEARSIQRLYNLHNLPARHGCECHGWIVRLLSSWNGPKRAAGGLCQLSRWVHLWAAD